MDLNEDNRRWLEGQVARIVWTLRTGGQSLGLAREAMINAFDAEVEKRCK